MSLTLRGIKGSALTHGELDNNFIWLSGRDIVAAVIDSNSNLILTKEDSSYYSVPLSGVNTYISGLTFSGNVLTITQSDGASVSVNISSVDIRVTDLVYSADTLILYQSDGSSETVLIPQFSGGTINGPTNFTNGLSANTFNTNFLTLNGVTITGFTTYDYTFTGGTVTGPTNFTNGLTANTFNTNSLTLNGVTITGFTNYVFTGNTSGDCITDLYITNLNSCSPLHIQPTSSGNVLVGENGGVNVGIGTSTPTEKLEVSGNTKLSSLSNVFKISSYTALGMSQGVGAANVFIGGGVVTDGANGGGISIGSSSTTYGDGVSIGQTAKADSSGGDAIAIGRSSTANGSVRSVAIGRNATSSASNAWALGYNAIASQDNSFIFGDSSDVNIKSGFGTNTPEARIHIKGSDSSTGFGLKVQNSGGTNTLQVRNDGLVEFGDVSQPSNTWLQYTGGTLKLNYNTTSNFYWNGSDLKLTGLNGNGNSKLEFTSINAKQQTLIRCYNNERLSFATNAGSANMQLSSSGNLYIGDDTISGVDASSRLEIRGSGTTSSGYGLKVQDSNGTDNFVVRNDGNVGIGTSTPSETLEVNGKTKTTNFQMTSGATSTGYVLTDSDGFGNAQWRPVSGITGVGNVFKYTTNLTFTDNETKTVTHNLNTKFIHCSVWDYNTEELVAAQVLRNGVNAVNITIATAGNYDILITG